MNKFWRVARYEYTRHVFRRRFIIFALLGLPLMIGFFILLGLVFSSIFERTAPIGYVDASGVLLGEVDAALVEDAEVSILRFETIEVARAALEAEEIQAYYVLPADYPETRQVELFYLKEPDGDIQRQFRDFVRTNLLKGLPSNLTQIVLHGADWTARPPDGSRQFSGTPGVINLLTPLLAAAAFMIALFTGGGYLFQAVLEEKENRTIEILVTSLSPRKLIGGKIIGLTAVALTPLLTWILTGLVVLLLARDEHGAALIQYVPLGTLLMIAAVMLPAFATYGALMMALGTTVTEAREGSALSGVFSMLASVPFYFFLPILTNPDSPLAVGLSLFPLSAPLTVAMRLVVSSFGFGEFALILVVQLVTTALAITLAARAFRLGLLRFGQRLSWREVLGRLQRAEA